MLPYVEPDIGQDIRYIVIVRNPEEALVSARPFFEKHTEAWLNLWQVPRAALTRPDFPTFYREVLDTMGLNRALFGFLTSWWPLRHRSNVLLMHFTDMKRDHEGSIRRIADFIGAHPTPDAWSTITEYTSFAWMKQHGTKFDALTATEVPVLEPGAMVRTGKAGAARGDGMTEDISAHLRAVGRDICADDQALEWFYGGGPVPQ